MMFSIEQVIRCKRCFVIAGRNKSCLLIDLNFNNLSGLGVFPRRGVCMLRTDARMRVRIPWKASRIFLGMFARTVFEANIFNSRGKPTPRAEFL